MAAQLKLEEFTPVFGPRVAHAFLDFHQANDRSLEVPEHIPRLPKNGEIEHRIILDEERGTLIYRATLEDILAFSDLTGDYNSVHTPNNPYSGKALVQGNFIAAFAESLVAAYFDKHHFAHVDAYFNTNHSWIPQPFRRLFSIFAIRNKYIEKLSYTFRDQFFPGDELELKVGKFEFRKKAGKDCKFSITCYISNPKVREEAQSRGEKYKPGLIKIEYGLVLPPSPKLAEVTESSPSCTDEVELQEGDFETYVNMLQYGASKMPVMFPVVSTNSRILLKRLAQMKEEGIAEFGTGIYQSYKVRLFKGARKVKLGDKLNSFYFCNEFVGPESMQAVTLFVTDEEQNVLYEFSAPILLLPEPDPAKVN